MMYQSIFFLLCLKWASIRVTSPPYTVYIHSFCWHSFIYYSLYNECHVVVPYMMKESVQVDVYSGSFLFLKIYFCLYCDILLCSFNNKKYFKKKIRFQTNYECALAQVYKHFCGVFFFFGIAFIWYCSLSKQRLSVLTVLIISLKWTHESHMRCCQRFTLLILLVVALQQNYWHHMFTRHTWLCLIHEHISPFDTAMTTHSLTHTHSDMHTYKKCFQMKETIWFTFELVVWAHHHDNSDFLPSSVHLPETANTLMCVYPVIVTTEAVCDVAVMWLLKWLGLLVTVGLILRAVQWSHTNTHIAHTHTLATFLLLLFQFMFILFQGILFRGFTFSSS